MSELVQPLGQMVGLAVIAVASWLLARRTKTNASKIDALHNEVRTNHGLAAGSYLEMVGELVEWSKRVDVKLDRSASDLQQHTAQDAENFAAIERHLARVDVKLDALPH